MSVSDTTTAKEETLSKIEGLEEFGENPLLRQFLTDDVDVRALTSSAVQSSAVAEQLAQLGSGIGLLDKAIRSQVAGHYEDLLSQATEIEALETVLSCVNERTSSLLGIAEKLSSRIASYELIRQVTIKLQRLHAVCDLLRKVIGVVRTARRLQTLLVKDKTKAAACLAELESTLTENDLAGIDILQDEFRLVESARSTLRNES